MPLVGHTEHMAWAEQLHSGRYRGLYRDSAGRRRSAGTFTHKAKAVRAAGALEERVRRNVAADPEAYKRPWGEWADEWWPTRNVAASTLKVDRARRVRHLDPRWLHTPLGSITRHEVKAWAAGMARDKVSPETVKRIVHLFSASLAAAVDAEILTSNPAARLRLPGGQQAMERYLTREEYEALRDAFPTTHDQFVFDMLIHTGLRWGELAGLHWNRVDLDRRRLIVAETWDERGGKIKAYPKGKRIREVPIVSLLRGPLAERQADAHRKGCGVDHAVGRCRSSLVVTTETGAVLRNSNWGEVWRKAVEDSGIGHARPHDCRHTFASWLLQAGIPLAEVSRYLGHGSIKTTERYAHLAAPPNAAVEAALAAPHLPHAASLEG